MGEGPRRPNESEGVKNAERVARDRCPVPVTGFGGGGVERWFAVGFLEWRQVCRVRPESVVPCIK